tara:strand:- start:690 stop:860 length:171 start_codon:yes stop_codon:yes gene_type:complete
MSNYPDDFPHHLLDDEIGEKLPCGCYEEACECPKCIYCFQIIDDDKEIVCSGCEEE